MLISENSLTPLLIDGAYLVKSKEFQDARGTLIKTYTTSLLESYGVSFTSVEDYSTVSKKGVIRGLHYQLHPFSQGKIISCVHGEVFDVIVDLRRSSATFGKASCNVLSSGNHLSVYAPRGMAHGFLSLSEGSIITYKADNIYSPEHERGLNWNDKSLSIRWPEIGQYVVSDKDRSWPTIQDCQTLP